MNTTVVLNNKIIPLHFVLNSKMQSYKKFTQKRLQTQSFRDPELQDGTFITDLSKKIIACIQNSDQTPNKVKMREKKQKVKERLKTKENEEKQVREKLRISIQSKMRSSKGNIERISTERKRLMSGRSMAEQARRTKIKQQTKNKKQKSWITSQNLQNQSTRHFQETAKNLQSYYSRLQKIKPTNPNSTRYQNHNPPFSSFSFQHNSPVNNSKSYTSRTQIQSDKKKQRKFLRVSDQDIRSKQDRRMEIFGDRETKIFGQFVWSMEKLVSARKRRQAKLQQKQQTATLPKMPKNSPPPLPSPPSRTLSIENKPPQSQPQPRAVSPKPSFSKVYQQKLSQKRNKKEMFHSLMLREGDQILRREQIKKKLLKEAKIIKESVNQYTRWVNLMGVKG